VTVVVAASAASTGEAGVLGFLVVAGMALALFFLFRSLNKQLHKITPDAQSRKQAKPRPTGADQDGPAGGVDRR
jgi:hypothetical protein